jgi:hypothetical protein
MKNIKQKFIKIDMMVYTVLYAQQLQNGTKSNYYS